MPNLQIPPNRARGIFPEGPEVDLLWAVLDPVQAAEHWARYLAGLGGQAPNEGEARLYPLVAAHLRGQLAEMVQGGMLEAALRRAQVQHLVLKRTKARLAEVLVGAGIPAYLTKGVALSESVYRPGEFRTSADIDLIIRWSDAEALVQLAKDAGWLVALAPKAFTEREALSESALCFSLPGLADADLAWAPRRPFAFDPHLRDRLWAQHSGAGIHVAPATWLLIETLEHGLYSNSVSPLRWVVDGVHLINRCGGQINWDWLLELAGRYKLALVVQTGLAICAQFGGDAPEAFMEALARLPVSAMEQAEFAAKVADAPVVNILAGLRGYGLLLRANDAQFQRLFQPKPVPKLMDEGLRLALEGRHLSLTGVMPRGAKALEAAGFVASALRLREARALEAPEDEAVVLRYAALAERFRGAEAALPIYAGLVERLPGSVKGRLELARLHLRRHDPAAAVGLCDAVLALSPENARAHALRGEARLELCETEAGLRDLETAMGLSPDAVGVRLQWARALLEEGRLEEALSVCGDSAEAALRLVLGQVLYRMGDRVGAEALFGALLAVDGGVEAGMVWAGEPLRAGEFGGAAVILRQVIARFPGAIGPYQMFVGRLAGQVEADDLRDVVNGAPDELRADVKFRLSVELVALLAMGDLEAAKFIAENLDRPQLGPEAALPVVRLYDRLGMTGVAQARMMVLLDRAGRDPDVIAAAIGLFGAGDAVRRGKVEAELTSRLTPRAKKGLRERFGD